MKIPDARFTLSLLLSLLIHAIFLYSSNTAGRHPAQNSAAKTWHGFEIRFSEHGKSLSPAPAVAIEQPDGTALMAEDQTSTQQPAHSNPQGAAQGAKTETIKTRPSLPVFDSGIEPVYPIQWLANGLRGSVKATFKIGPDGQIDHIEIVDSQPAGRFDSVVLAAIRAATIRKGSAVPGSRFSITVVFDPSGTGAEGAVFPRLEAE